MHDIGVARKVASLLFPALYLDSFQAMKSSLNSDSRIKMFLN